MTIQETVKNIHDLLPQVRRVTTRENVEDTGLPYHVAYNIITAELDMKNFSAI